MFCPKCGKPSFTAQSDKEFRCRLCLFQYFHNAAAATAVIIECDGYILLTRRNQEPGRGKLDLPGGFVDPGESLEQALVREVEEELGIQIKHPQYLNSFANRYPFGEVTYSTTDVVFSVSLPGRPDIEVAEEEIFEVIWIEADAVDLEDFAFESSWQAIQFYWLNQKSQS